MRRGERTKGLGVVLGREVRTAGKKKEREKTDNEHGNPYCVSPDTLRRSARLTAAVEFQHLGRVDSSDRADDLTSAALGCLVRHRGRSQAAPTSPSGSLPSGFTYNHEEGGGGAGMLAEGERERGGRGEGEEPIAGRRPVVGRGSRRGTQRGKRGREGREMREWEGFEFSISTFTHRITSPQCSSSGALQGYPF